MMKIGTGFLLSLLLISNHVIAGEFETSLQSRLSKLERMVDNRGLLKILDEIESLQQEVRELRGEVEQQAYTIDQMKQQQQNLSDARDQRPQGQSIAQNEQPTLLPVIKTKENQPVTNQPDLIEQEESSNDVRPGHNASESRSVLPVETYVAKKKAGANASVSSTEPGSDTVEYPQSVQKMKKEASEETDYSEAFNLLKLGKKNLAIDKFRTFLQLYPAGSYADNAQYWLGEAYFSKRDFKTAIQEYKTLLSHYPDSGKVSHALLKVGYCYDELGQADFAQGELENLIARFPETSAARLAEERLMQIRSR